MPVSQLLKYADEVDVGVAPQDVNLVDMDSYGHRVAISVLTSVMNSAFSWSRAAGSARPVGHFADSDGSFQASLASAMNTLYIDTDAVASKLSFDSSALSSNPDPRVREGGQVSANDLMMAYVLYKVYGSSFSPTQEIVFNLEDAYGMLASSDYAAAIVAAFNNSESQVGAAGNEKGAVDAMFRDLLAADPLRFFDASGNQVPGLFETNADASGSGTWNLVQDDVIEVRTVFTFQHAVTLRTSLDVAQNLTPLPEQSNDETIYIAAGSKLSIRLQIAASNTGASGEGGGGGGGGATAPTAPRNVTLTPGDSEIDITWSAPSSNGGSAITGYEVYNDGTLVTTTAAQTTSYTITGLSNGTSYSITIKAVNSIDSSSPSSAVSATPFRAPDTPANVTVTSGDSEVTISWDAPTDISVTSHNIYTNDWGTINVAAPATSHTLGAANGVTYTGIYVKAVNADGESVASSTFSVTPSPTSVPNTPTGLITGMNGPLHTLTWDSDSGLPSVQGYNIYLNEVLYSSIQPTTYVEIPNLVPGITYNVELVATNTIGESDPASISITPQNLPISPSGLKVTPYNSRVHVSWAATGQTLSAYKVYFSTNGSFTGSPATTVSGTTLSADIDMTNIAGFANGVVYGVLVTAVDADGLESIKSQQASFTATTSPVPSPVNMLTTTHGDSSITVTWSEPIYAGATTSTLSYNLYYLDQTNGYLGTLTGITGLSTTIPSLTNGRNYSVRVTAVSADGESPQAIGYSGYVGELSSTPLTTPENPQNVSATPGDETATITWTAPSYTGESGGSISSYKVYLGTNAPVSVSAPSTSYTATGLTNGTNYNIRVSAVSSDGESFNYGVQTSVRPNVLPAAPSVSVAAIDTGLVIGWTPTANNAVLDTYKLYINGNLVTNIGATSRSITIRPLTNGTSYNVRVSAANNIGEGPLSTLTSGTPAPASPGPLTVGGVLAAYVGAVPSTLSFGASVTAISPTALINPVTGAIPTNITSISLASTNITVIPDSTFIGFTGLASITIPETLTSIGSQSFAGCTNLTPIDFSSTSLQSIGPQAFSGCTSLTSITLPAGFLSLGESCFAYSGLTSIVIPSGVTLIPNGAFEHCEDMTSITIPSTVTTIDTNSMAGCTSLTSITIPTSVTSIGPNALANCTSLTSINLSALELTALSSGILAGNTSLTSILLPSTITSIGEQAFMGCSALASISIPAGVTSMGTGALRGCSSLTSINLSQTQITVLNNQMFYGNTSLSSILLPLDLTSFADDTYIFYQCNVLTSIQIPVGVTTLPTGLFSRATALTSVRIPTSFDLAAWTDILATAGYTGTIIRV